MRGRSALALAMILFLCGSARAGMPWVVYEGTDGPGKGKHIVLVAADDEYRSEELIPQLAKILARHHGFKCTVLFAIDKKDGTINPGEKDNIPGLEILKDADLLVLFARFRQLPDEQMKFLVDYLDTGKPIIGLRTSTHAFNYGKSKSPYAKFSFQSREGDFGRLVLGETWVNHWGKHNLESTRGVIAKGMEMHPILKGVEDIWGPSDVYEIRKLTGDSQPLVMGQVLKGMSQRDEPVPNKAMMPIAWVKSYTSPSGKTARVFATTMGHGGDFKSEGVRRMLVNACYWCLGMEAQIPARSNVDIVGSYDPPPIGVGRHKKGVKPADLALTSARSDNAVKERHFLYVAVPGIRNYLEFGGAGILVFDMDNGYKFVRRIATPASKQAAPENIKGVCACAKTGRLYFTTLTRLYCVDLASDKTLWDRVLPGGCDRMAITPDGKWLFVPSYEKDHWNIVDGATGSVSSQVIPKSGAHNTVCSLDGTRVYLAGLRSPILTVVDGQTHKVVAKVGPFSNSIRPFTVNAAKTRCYVNVNKLLGFEIGDLTTGKMLARVEVEGFPQGKTKRHGCPSHGVGLTPDEKEVWVCDAANSRMHIFDNTVMPPKQVASIKLREQPGWITFSLDGRHAFPSTGEVIDTKTRKILYALTDETGREVHSEKVVEIVFVDGVPVRNGDQFGTGRKQP